MELNSDLLNLVNVLKSEKTVCLLAPSFPVDFEFPEILKKLKQIWFEKVVELTYAAKIINLNYHKLFEENPDRQFICTNCPTIVKLIENKYPQHKDKLIDIASPMVIMARFAKSEFGEEYKTIFVGPCLAKKMEAKESWTVDFAITFKELQEIFDYYQENKLPYKEFNFDVTESGDIDFDKFYNDYTKVYPLSGGVAQTMHTKDILKEDQILIVDGILWMEEAMKKFESDTNIKFLDALSCIWWCIWWPGVISKDSVEVKEKKVREYKEYCKKDKIWKKLWKFEFSEWLEIRYKTKETG